MCSPSPPFVLLAATRSAGILGGDCLLVGRRLLFSVLREQIMHISKFFQSASENETKQGQLLKFQQEMKTICARHNTFLLPWKRNNMLTKQHSLFSRKTIIRWRNKKLYHTYFYNLPMQRQLLYPLTRVHSNCPCYLMNIDQTYNLTKRQQAGDNMDGFVMTSNGLGMAGVWLRLNLFSWTQCDYYFPIL